MKTPYVQVVDGAPAIEGSPCMAMAMASQVAEAIGAGAHEVLAADFIPNPQGGELTLTVQVPHPYPPIITPPMCTERPKVMHVYDLGAERCRCGKVRQSR